jgi:hypothetical protein
MPASSISLSSRTVSKGAVPGRLVMSSMIGLLVEAGRPRRGEA